MRHGSLFSGVGGFDLAAEWMGWENVFHCENNEFCQKVLKYYWPHAEQFGDIKTTDFTKFNGLVDIVTGGFPCQPYSVAGKRKGNQDDRHFWPEMLRAIREIQPEFIVGENVYGLVNWSRGLVFEQVQIDLENEGYEVAPVILPACSKNAPHKRERIWFVAYSNVADTEQQRRKGANIVERSIRFKPGTWDSWPTTEPAIRSRNDGIPHRLDTLTFPKWRNESLKSYGNAIVPQVAYEIFQAIESVNFEKQEEGK